MRSSLLWILLLLACVGCKNSKDRNGNSVPEIPASKPEDNRFIPIVLTPDGALDEPMMFQFLRTAPLTSLSALIPETRASGINN